MNDESDDYLSVPPPPPYPRQRSWLRCVFADVYLSFYILSSRKLSFVLDPGEDVMC